MSVYVHWVFKTAEVDSSMGEEIMNLMLALNMYDNSTVVMVTHDEGLAEKTGRIIRMVD